MRTDIREATASGVTERFRLSTGAFVASDKHVLNYTAHSVIRSDVVVNPVGVDGWRKPSPYSADVTKVEPARLTGRVDTSIQFIELDQPFTLGVLPDRDLGLLMPSYAEYAQAEVKALNALANRKGSMAESVAEMRSTVQGLARSATTIRTFAELAHRGKMRDAARVLGMNPYSRSTERILERIRAAGNTFGGAWLNFWFGLSPIVSDMVSYAALLSDDSIHQKMRVKGTGRSKSNSEKSGSSVVSVYCNVPWAGKAESTSYVSLTGQITMPQLRRLVTFGAADIPQAAWAIVPYSFVIDWVLPVSEVLRAHTASVGITFRGGTRTDRVLYTAKTGSPTIRSPYIDKTLGASEGSCSQMKMRRSVYRSWPRPVTLWVKDPLDTWKAITGLSLLATRLKSFK